MFRGKGYPSLWPSKDCQEPLDVSNDFTFKVIDGILSGNITSSFPNTVALCYNNINFFLSKLICLNSNEKWESTI